jgi:epoxyqueuosine reductase
LTIELREAVPRDLRPAMGDWLFGCDVCQDVCPWNHKAPVADEPAFLPASGQTSFDLAELFALDDVAFRARFRGTPLWRPQRRGLLRNAAIVLGNRRPPEGLMALQRGLRDAEPLVRGASAWALGQYATDEAAAALSARHDIESDPHVREEIDAALFVLGATAGSPNNAESRVDKPPVAPEELGGALH